LFHLLTARGWKVFLDRKQLKAGDEWRVDILEALAEAHAGVVLFDRRAAGKSPWVSAEALILCFHKSIDPDHFQFIPVLLEKADLKHTCFSKYEPFRLHEIEALRDDTKRTPAQMAARIADQLRLPDLANCQSSRWVSNVVSLLRNVHVDVLEKAAAHLKVYAELRRQGSAKDRGTLAREHLVPDLQGRQPSMLRACAALMHHQDATKNLAAFRELLQDRNLEKEALKTYLMAKWVPNEATAMLLYASHKPDTLGLLTINTANNEVVDQYRHRILIELTGPPACAFTVSDPPGEGDSFLLHHLEQAFRTEILQSTTTYYGPGFRPLSVAEAVSRHIRNSGQITICMLPAKYAKKDFLRNLRKDYPGVIFVVQVGFAEKRLESFVPIGATPLRPCLNLEKHNELAQLSIDLTTAIKNTI
jgi:hypothetical protein